MVTWGKWYWPIWLVTALVTLLGTEVYAIVVYHRRGIDNTFSNWVRTALHIVKGEHLAQWSSTDLLVFCAYISIFVAWLPWHFWFRKFN